jgi:hypothetical protein
VKLSLVFTVVELEHSTVTIGVTEMQSESHFVTKGVECNSVLSQKEEIMKGKQILDKTAHALSYRDNAIIGHYIYL